MRGHLKSNRYSQIPQLSSMNPIDVNTKFDLVPDTATGTKRAVMIGINYVGKCDATILCSSRNVFCQNIYITSSLPHGPPSLI